MRSAAVTTDVSNPERSEEASLPFADGSNQPDKVVQKIDLGLLAPLLVGMAAVILFVLSYAYLLQKLG
jgi:flagellar biogenesis protein FliO